MGNVHVCDREHADARGCPRTSPCREGDHSGDERCPDDPFPLRADLHGVPPMDESSGGFRVPWSPEDRQAPEHPPGYDSRERERKVEERVEEPSQRAPGVDPTRSFRVVIRAGRGRIFDNQPQSKGIGAPLFSAYHFAIMSPCRKASTA